jgi:hypothetical protein
MRGLPRGAWLGVGLITIGLAAAGTACMGVSQWLVKKPG